MSLFGALIKTAVNVATLPVSVAADAFTLGGVANDRDEPYTVRHLRMLKREAEGDEE